MADQHDGVDYDPDGSADPEQEQGQDQGQEQGRQDQGKGPRRPWGDVTPEDEPSNGRGEGGDGDRSQGQSRQEDLDEAPEEGDQGESLRPSLAQNLLERYSGDTSPFNTGFPEEQDVTQFLGEQFVNTTVITNEVRSNPTYRVFWKDVIQVFHAVNREKDRDHRDYRHPYLLQNVDTPVPLPSQDPHFWASVTQALLRHTQSSEQVHGETRTSSKVLCPWCKRRTAVDGFAKHLWDAYGCHAARQILNNEGQAVIKAQRSRAYALKVQARSHTPRGRFEHESAKLERQKWATVLIDSTEPSVQGPPFRIAGPYSCPVCHEYQGFNYGPVRYKRAVCVSKLLPHQNASVDCRRLRAQANVYPSAMLDRALLAPVWAYRLNENGHKKWFVPAGMGDQPILEHYKYEGHLPTEHDANSEVWCVTPDEADRLAAESEAQQLEYVRMQRGLSSGPHDSGLNRSPSQPRPSVPGEEWSGYNNSRYRDDHGSRYRDEEDGEEWDQYSSQQRTPVHDYKMKAVQQPPGNWAHPPRSGTLRPPPEDDSPVLDPRDQQRPWASPAPVSGTGAASSGDTQPVRTVTYGPSGPHVTLRAGPGGQPMSEVLPSPPTRPPPGAPEAPFAPTTTQQMTDLIAATVAKQLRSFKDELMDAAPAPPAATAAPMQVDSAVAEEAPSSGAAGSAGPAFATASKTAGAPPTTLPGWVVKQENAKGVTTRDQFLSHPEEPVRSRRREAAGSSSAATAAKFEEDDENVDSRKRNRNKMQRKETSSGHHPRKEDVEAAFDQGMRTVDQAIADLRELEDAFLDASRDRSKQTLEALNHALTTMPKQIRHNLRTVRQNLTDLRDEANQSQTEGFSILFGDASREDVRSRRGSHGSTPADTPR